MSSDERSNVPAIPDSGIVTPIPISVFEGEVVRYMDGKIPTITLEMDGGYPRGTHLVMEVPVRVRKVSIEEGKGKRAGELVRVHDLVVDGDVLMKGAFTAEAMDSGVGGGLAVTGNDVEDEDPEPEETDERPDHCGDPEPHEAHTSNEDEYGSSDFCTGTLPKAGGIDDNDPGF